MKELDKKKTINECCKAIGKTRQGYYDNIRREQCHQVKETNLIKLVLEYRKKMPKLGTRKLKHCLYDKKRIKIGRDKLFMILRENGLLIKKRRKYAKTTNSKHWYKRYPDSLNSMTIYRAEQAFVSDITYIRTKKGFCYLPIVTDAYSKRIMGYYLSKDLSAKGCELSLRMALDNRMYNLSDDTVHHSDRGIQYCTKGYVDLLTKNKIKISMTETSSPYDNAIAERINGILKDEFSLDYCFEDYNQAKKAVDEAIKIYNFERPHLSCNFLTPYQAHLKGTNLKNIWKM